MDIPSVAAGLWATLSPDPIGPLDVVGPRVVLAATFDVTGLAAASIGVATAAAARLLATRRGVAEPTARVDTRRAAAAFTCEARFQPVGWERVGGWDPVAGDYRAADGWIRLHTNYAHHRRAALAVLGLPDTPGAGRDDVAREVTGWPATALEQQVVDAGGAAAAMHDRGRWRTRPHGVATAAIAPVEIVGGDVGGPPRPWRGSPGPHPLSGVRVLDLTRVIAGPVCTGFLAGHGADVLRIDPPGFAEVAALLPVVTAGKRCAALDLTAPDGRARFAELVADADVLVHGMRPGALERLGFGGDALRRINPALVDAGLDAYGWTGPWAGRRGFDSLVQMSCGIAAAGAAAAGVDHPVPLPAQALDHGTGYLLAAGVMVALAAQHRNGVTSDVRASLLGTANMLCSLDAPPAPPADEGVAPADELVAVSTAWGPARAVGPAATIDGQPAPRLSPAGPLGRDEPSW